MSSNPNDYYFSQETGSTQLLPGNPQIVRSSILPPVFESDSQKDSQEMSVVPENEGMMNDSFNHQEIEEYYDHAANDSWDPIHFEDEKVEDKVEQSEETREVGEKQRGCMCPFVRESLCITEEERELVYSENNWHRCSNNNTNNSTDPRCPNKFWGACFNNAPKYGLSEMGSFQCRKCNPTFLLSLMYIIIIIIIIIIILYFIKFLKGSN